MSKDTIINDILKQSGYSSDSDLSGSEHFFRNIRDVLDELNEIPKRLNRSFKEKLQKYKALKVEDKEYLTMPFEIIKESIKELESEAKMLKEHGLPR